MKSALTLLLLVARPAAAAEPVQAPTSIFVDTYRDSTREAARVTPSGLGYVTLIRADGSKSYVMEKDVLSIRDSNGRDWTARVLTERKGVGSAPIITSEQRRSARSHDPPHLRGRPSPLDKAFPIIQVGFLGRLDQTGGWTTDLGGSIVSDIGGMRNIGPHAAAGMTVHLNFSERFSQIGAKARFRRWLGRTTSLDFAPGFVVGASDDPYQYPEFVSEASLTLGDWVALTGQMELRRRTVYLGDDTDVAWLLGIKVGGELGLLAFIPVIAAASSWHEPYSPSW